jgi:pimeloyl-ACP methyl ester carboxylesterase
MHNILLMIASREWFGIFVAAAVGAAGAALRRFGVGAVSDLGIGLLAVAAALAIGAAFHLVSLTAARLRFRPAGKRVDVGGFSIHVIAEGAQTGRPGVVWFGGGHSSGAVMNHLHRAVRGNVRSILIDRPGTGWSDTGPFPRTTAREAEEVIRALECAGEQGPFVFAGHSFGGLLVANIARRRPDLVASLVLLDPTPLETIVFGPRLGALSQMRRDAIASGVLRLFGVHVDVGALRIRADRHHKEVEALYNSILGEALDRVRQVEISAGAMFARYSIFRELSPEGVARCAWETVVYDGDLGDMAVYLVAPGSAEEVLENPDVAAAAAPEMARMHRFFARTRERYMATSSRASRIVTPAGSTHQFVYEHPDFVAKKVLEIASG